MTAGYLTTVKGSRVKKLLDMFSRASSFVLCLSVVITDRSIDAVTIQKLSAAFVLCQIRMINRKFTRKRSYESSLFYFLQLLQVQHLSTQMLLNGIINIRRVK